MKKILFVILFCLITSPCFSAVDDSYTKLLLHCDGVDASTTFTDEAGKTVTAVDTAQLDTAQYEFGTASGLFDGNSDYLSLDDSDDWNFGAGDFTIDGWVRFNSVTNSQVICSQCIDGGNSWEVMYFQLFAIKRLQFSFVSESVSKASYSTNWVPVVNTWYHIAIERTTTTAKIFINGVSQTLTENTAFGTNDVGNIAHTLEIGRRDMGGATDAFFNGWIDELRISKGIARWNADFTPPTSAYSPSLISSTVIFNGNIKLNGNVKLN
jgi:hypothetical protein